MMFKTVMECGDEEIILWMGEIFGFSLAIRQIVYFLCNHCV